MNEDESGEGKEFVREFVLVKLNISKFSLFLVFGFLLVYFYILHFSKSTFSSDDELTLDI